MYGTSHGNYTGTDKGLAPSPVVANWPDLQEYTQFLELIDRAKTTKKEEPLTWAIQEAVRRNIMKDYLERKGGETLSILMAEYDFDTAIAVRQEEAYASGREEGAYQKTLETAKAMIVIGLPEEQIQLCTGLPLEAIQYLMQK